MLDYSSSEDEEIKPTTTTQNPIKPTSKIQKKLQKLPTYGLNLEINPNPDADITQLQETHEQQQIEIFKAQNPEIFQDSQIKTAAGQVDKINTDQEKEQMNMTLFNEQHRNFVKYGFAYDPKIDSFVNNMDKENFNLSDMEKIIEDQKNEGNIDQQIVFNQNVCPDLYDKLSKGQTINQEELKEMMAKAYGLRKKQEKKLSKEMRAKRLSQGDAGNAEFQGPWAKYQNEDAKNMELDEEEKERIKKIEEKRKEKIVQEKETQEKQKTVRTTSEFHGDERRDYQGRSFVQPPKDLKYQEHKCFLPKKCVKTWSDHTKGVQTIKFFPKYGHYLLSASLDSTIKLWSTHGEKKLTRTYMGHNKAVRDIGFTNNGYHFISGGYDKQINYWDTETGKIVQNIKLKSFPYSIKLHPDESKEHSFILGSSNKKIMQFDLRTGNRTQVYDEHLGAINSITFINHNRNFVSTSDDKKIFVWEYGVPVVIKHLAEPDMHAVHNTEVSPNYMYMAAQQANNKIAIYDLKGGNFRLNKKKEFMGHKSTGYAIGMAFSDDGKYFCSGDNEGRAYFWDWKTGKNYRTMDAHDGVCIDVAWNPLEPSKVATCGWDGLIKYWD